MAIAIRNFLFNYINYRDGCQNNLGKTSRLSNSIIPCHTTTDTQNAHETIISCALLYALYGLFMFYALFMSSVWRHFGIILHIFREIDIISLFFYKTSFSALTFSQYFSLTCSNAWKLQLFPRLISFKYCCILNCCLRQ